MHFAQRGIICFLVLFIPLSCFGQEQPVCAATIGEFRALMGEAFPLRWEETSMDDGKPLVVSILERNGALFIEFIKTREGLWAEGAGLLCKAGSEIETRFGEGQMRTGPAANWLLRTTLGRGGKFTLTKLGHAQMRISTSGWSGDFSPGIK